MTHRQFRIGPAPDPSHPAMTVTPRRDFLKTATRTTAGLSVLSGVTLPHVFGQSNDDSIRSVLIGCGGRGSGAARFTTPSKGPDRSHSPRSPFRSQMSMRSIENPGRPASRFSRQSLSRTSYASFMLSTPTTLCPAPRSSSQVLLAMKPAAPVTRYVPTKTRAPAGRPF